MILRTNAGTLRDVCRRLYVRDRSKYPLDYRYHSRYYSRVGTSRDSQGDLEMDTDRIIELVKEARQFRGNHPHPIADFDRATGSALSMITWSETHGKEIDISRMMIDLNRMVASIPRYEAWSTAPWYQPRVKEIADELSAIIAG